MPDFAAASRRPVALITGAASGIGAALTQRLAAQAESLILIDRDEAGLRALADSLATPPDRVSLFAFDVADVDAWGRTRELITGLYGRVDLACACAGVSAAAAIPDQSFAGWRAVMSANLDGAFLTLQTAMALMRLQPGGGSIVVVSSVAGEKAEPGIAAYAASKAGVDQLARVAAKEGAADQIRVNVIAPGGVRTPLWRSMDFFNALIEERGSEAAAFAALAEVGTPLGRYAEADEIAALIEMLLLQSAPMTGARLVVDGGYRL